MKLVIVLAFLLFTVDATAARLHLEKEYQEAFCASIGGETEYRLFDATRVDCLTKYKAIEADFADKWAEAIGQSLHYAMQTNRKPGILLILESTNDLKYLDRLNPLAYHLGIEVWTTTPEDLIPSTDSYQQWLGRDFDQEKFRAKLEAIMEENRESFEESLK